MKRIAILALLVISSCCPMETYVKADRLKYDLIAPKFRNYILGDSQMTSQEREIWLRHLATWEWRIIQNEESQK